MIKKLLCFAFIVISVKLFAQAPTLSNFRIENSEKSRVYFDSNVSITGSDIAGFFIGNKTITGITVASNATSGHYFTVGNAFNFWDNHTIRYEGGSDIKDASDNALHLFTLSYIHNTIPEPDVSNTEYYVTTSGSDSNDGLTESTSFGTIQKALDVAGAGNTVWIKAGVYNTRASTYVRNSGTVNNPLKIIGYKNNTNDITSTYYNYTEGQIVPDLDPSEMPLMDGGNGRYSGIFSVDNDYVIMKNIQAQRYFTGLGSKQGIGFYMDNCITKDMYGNGSEEGEGIDLGGIKTGSDPYEISKIRVTNSIAINGGISNLSVYGTNNLIENCKTYNDRSGGGGDIGSDYYITVIGDHNVCRNSRAAAIDKTVNPASHGIGAKATEYNYPDWGTTTSYNLFEKNYVKSGSQEGYFSRNIRADYNVFKDCEVVGFGSNVSADGVGISNQTGAQNNIYERMNIRNLYSAFVYQSGTEAGSNPAYLHTNNNIIKNSVVENVRYIILTDNARNVVATFDNNKIYNCTFNNAQALNKGSHSTSNYFSFTNNDFVNCIFNNVIAINSGSRKPFLEEMFEIDNSNFHGGFAQPSWATNSTSVNPELDIDLKLTIATPTEIFDGGKDIPSINYDMDNIERISGKYSVGAYDDAVPVVGSVSADVSICVGESTILVARGGTSYLWNTGEDTAELTVSPNETTTYTVTISDGIYSDSHDVIVTVDQVPSVTILESDFSMCSDETVTLTAEGEGDFLWSTGETTASIDVNPSLTTTYTVTASNSCSTDATDEIIVTVNPGVIVDAGNDVSICTAENITLTAVSNGDFLWSTGETTASITVSPSATTIYTVTSTLDSCSNTDEVEVTVNQAPSVTILESDFSMCSDETVTLTAEGEGDFLWSTGETTASIDVNPSLTTTYTVTASNSCSTDATDEIIVTVNPGVILDAGDDISICTAESITLTAESNGDFLWSTGETTASITVNPSATTIYTVTSILGSCSNTDEVEVTVNQTPSVIISEPDFSICSGESVTLTADGIGNFLWNTGETTASINVNPSSTTTYTVTSTNSCSVEATDEITITVNPAVTVNAGNDVSLCNGESVTLTAAGNGDFLWSTGETTASISVSPSTTTTYSVTSTLGSCSDVDLVQVQVNQAPTVSLESDFTICSEERITLTAEGVGNFLWSTGETSASISVSPSTTTTYTVTASNSCSETATDEITITVNPGVTIDAGEDVSICVGESITLTAAGNGTFLWSTGETSASISVSPSTTTTYSVTSTIGSCSNIDLVQVFVNQVPSVSLVSDFSICSGESVTLRAQGVGNFLWSTGETSASIGVSPSATTTYTVTSTNSCSTNASDEITITVNQTVTVDAGTDVSICMGESVTLTATGNGNFLWSTGETTASITVNPSTTTIYTVTSNQGSCSNSDEVEVTVNQGPSVTILESDFTICSGESVTLTAEGTGNFLWSTGETDASINVAPLDTTIYTVTTSSTGTCASSVTDTVTVNVNKEPVATANDDIVIESGSSVDLTVSGVGSFEWSTGEIGTRITVRPTVTTTYIVTASTGEGCSVNDEVVVTVVDEFVPTETTISVGQDITICPGDTVILEAPSGTRYLWGSGETESSIRVSPSETTIYSVKVYNGDDSKTIHSTITVTDNCSEGISATSNSSFNLDQEITLYPNPSRGIVNIKLTGFNDESKISVFNLNGVMVYSEVINNSSKLEIYQKQLNLSRFPKGIYLVRFGNNGSNLTKKVFLQ